MRSHHSHGRHQRSRPRAKIAPGLTLALMLCAGASLGAQSPAVPRSESEILDSAYVAAEAGAWEASAHAWRRVLDQTANLAGAAAYTLRSAGNDARGPVRRAFLAPPVSIGGRRALAQLEITWGSASLGWDAIRDLPASDSVTDAWIDFGDAASAAGSPVVARDAYLAALAVRPSGDLAARAAESALAAGDATTALSLLDRVMSVTSPADTAALAVALVPVHVRALVRLGRMNDAEQYLRRYEGRAGEQVRASLARDITWGYARVGDIAGARSAATRFGLMSDSTITGWLALYAGDLKNARGALRRTSGLSADALTALALLARTRTDSAPAVGEAFVLLARGDTAMAADRFVAASAVVRDAAPLLLATAARLHAAQHHDDLAIPLWRQVIEQYADAPEAPEADLEWGRALKRTADPAGAVARWEHLILTYPESALVPLARQEMDAVKSTA
jgi:tetratricopeptide (TPR) repeat protein